MAGNTTSYGAGGEDFLIMKLDGSGILLWTQTIGKSGDDDAYSIKETSDGGYVVCGETNSDGAGIRDGLILKFDSARVLQWAYLVGGAYDDGFRDIIVTTSGNYVAAGYVYDLENEYSDLDGLISQFDGAGVYIGSSVIGGWEIQALYSIDEAEEGKLLVSGVGTYIYDTDVLYAKTKPNGMITDCYETQSASPTVSAVTDFIVSEQSPVVTTLTLTSTTIPEMYLGTSIRLHTECSKEVVVPTTGILGLLVLLGFIGLLLKKM